MLIRISLIVAIVAGLAVGGLNFVKVKEKITTLMTERDQERSMKETAQRELAETSRELDQTKADLTQTKQELETATAEREKAVAEATQASRRAERLQGELETMRIDLSEAQAEREAYRQSGLSPEQVVTLVARLKETQDTLAGAQEENKLLATRITKLQNRLDYYEVENHVVRLPASISGEVLVSDPKWDFVVVNVGEDDGVLERGELLVHRNGNLVGKIRVTSVQKDRSVANLVPGWKKADILEGDQIIPAHPQS